ncbi:hypothetical protein FOFC_09390, partial [Fusarium oxysporum]
ASAIVHCRRQSAFGWTKDSGAGEAMLSLAVICNEASTQATLASHGCTRDARGGQATGGILVDIWFLFFSVLHVSVGADRQSAVPKTRRGEHAYIWPCRPAYLT